MKVWILTPEKTIYQGEASCLCALGLDGFFQLLDHHSPMISILKEGEVNLRLPKSQEATYLSFSIKSGLLQVKDNIVIIMTD